MSAVAVLQGLGRAYGLYKMAQPHVKRLAQGSGASKYLRSKGKLAEEVGDFTGLYKKGGKITKGGQAVLHKGEAVLPKNVVSKNKAVVDKLLKSGGKRIKDDMTTKAGDMRKGARKAYQKAKTTVAKNTKEAKEAETKRAKMKKGSKEAKEHMAKVRGGKK